MRRRSEKGAAEIGKNLGTGRMYISWTCCTLTGRDFVKKLRRPDGDLTGE